VLSELEVVILVAIGGAAALTSVVSTALAYLQSRRIRTERAEHARLAPGVEVSVTGELTEQEVRDAVRGFERVLSRHVGWAPAEPQHS
jgi:hypothetical protein